MSILTVTKHIQADIDWHAIMSFFPEWKAMASCPQDKFYHAEGDVWTHTKMVCEALVANPIYQSMSAERQQVMFLSTLLHDVSKPSVTKEEDGRISSKGHSKRGEIDARIILWKAGYDFHLRESVCRMIAVHQVPFMLISRSLTPEFDAHQLSHVLNINELCLLAESDARGRKTVPASDWQSTIDNVALFKLLAEDEGCLDAPYPVADPYTGFRYFRTTGAVPAMHALHREVGSKVIVMSGLPASGKDTWLAKHHPHLPVMSFDDAREELEIKAGAKDIGRAVHLVTDRAKELLRAKQDFAFNATHLSPDMRNKTLDLLFNYHAEVEIVYLETNHQETFSRNTKRDSTLANKDIERMMLRWQPPLQIEAPLVNYYVDKNPTIRPTLKC